MKNPPLEKSILLPRIQGITEALAYLQKLSKMPFKDFAKSPYFGDANFHLHAILEGIFNVGNHILSRIPGGTRNATRYADTAISLGKYGIVPKEFAENVLVPIARYRNRLVHGYSQITPKETYKILQKNLKDVEQFLKYIKIIMKQPKKFGLTLE